MMNKIMNKVILQISSGNGPLECGWVVNQVLKFLIRECTDKNIGLEIIRQTEGPIPDNLNTVLIQLTGLNADSFAAPWIGPVLWIGQSPYRKFHKRKNWFVGVSRIQPVKRFSVDEKDFIIQTTRSSGPGGQHLNKTESAVKAVHSHSGISVTIRDSRSQFQNKKLAIQRLHQKLEIQFQQELLNIEQENWQLNRNFERGNPVKIFKGKDFISVLSPYEKTFMLL